MHVLIVGCGYVGKRFAKQAISLGWNVTALTRSQERANELQKSGMHAVVGDVLDRDSLKGLPSADLCLYAVGYDRTASPAKRDVYVTGLKNVLNEIQDRVPRLIYISSTSVYGESSGMWVNEETGPQPVNESGEICLAAEQVVQESYSNSRTDRQATILRLSGIYGPGRLIGRKEQLREEKPISGNPNAWLNLIHIDDILQALFRIIDTKNAAPLYLLSDNQPNRRIDFYSELAKQLGTPSPVMPDEPTENLGKRCDSTFIRKELELKLIRPTIQEGIPASIG